MNNIKIEIDGKVIEIDHDNKQVMIDGELHQEKQALWKPLEGESSYILTGNGTIFLEGFSSTQHYHSHGRAFETKHEAEEFRDREKLIVNYQHRISELNHEQAWIADWGDDDQPKCYLYFDWEDMKAKLKYNYYIQKCDPKMYGSKKTIKTVQQEFKEDIKFILTAKR